MPETSESSEQEEQDPYQQQEQRPPQVWRQRVTDEFEARGRAFVVSPACRLDCDQQRLSYEYAHVDDFLTWGGPDTSYRAFRIQPGSVVFAFPEDEGTQNPYVALVLDIFQPLQGRDLQDVEDMEEPGNVLVDIVWLYRQGELKARATQQLDQTGLPHCYIRPNAGRAGQGGGGLPRDLERHLDSGLLNEVFLSFDRANFCIDRVMDTVTVHFLPQDSGLQCLLYMRTDATGPSRPQFLPGLVCRHVYDHLASKLHPLESKWKYMKPTIPPGMQELVRKLIDESRLRRVHWKRMARGDDALYKEVVMLEHVRGWLPSQAQQWHTQMQEATGQPTLSKQVEMVEEEDELPLQMFALHGALRPGQLQPGEPLVNSERCVKVEEEPRHEEEGDAPGTQQANSKQQWQEEEEKEEVPHLPTFPPSHIILCRLAALLRSGHAKVDADGCVSCGGTRVKPKSRKGEQGQQTGWAVYIKEGSQERCLAWHPSVKELLVALPACIPSAHTGTTGAAPA